MGNRLDGRVAIVTGAARGIGAGIARVFASHGARVVVADRHTGQGKVTAETLRSGGGEASFFQVDLAVPAEIDALVEESAARHGGLDIVVHNAGVYPYARIDELSEEALDLTLAVNLKACFRLTRRAVPHMRKRGAGRVLITSSVTGPRVAMPGLAHYAASKAGVNGFIRSAALEYASEGITVNGVEPGYIRTGAMDLLGNAEELQAMERCIPMGKLGVPEDIAHAMLFLASEEASYITGQTIVVDGGSTLPENPLLGNRDTAPDTGRVQSA